MSVKITSIRPQQSVSLTFRGTVGIEPSPSRFGRTKGFSKRIRRVYRIKNIKLKFINSRSSQRK